MNPDLGRISGPKTLFISITGMLEELTNEVENLRRDDLEGNLILFQKCRKFRF